MTALTAKSDSRIARRRFNTRLVMGIAGAIFLGAGRPLKRDSILRRGGLPDAQAVAFGLTMRATRDLARSAGLPFEGVYGHAWCGNSSLFRFSDRAAEALSSQCVNVLGMTEGEGVLRNLMRSFFGNDRTQRESAVFVLLKRGHISRSSVFPQRDIGVNVTSPPDCPMQRAGTPRPRTLSLGFSQASADFRAIMKDSPWPFTLPTNNPDAVLWMRRRYRHYVGPDGSDMGSDFIFQFSPADQDGAQPTSLARGGYFPNTAPLRERYRDHGYADLSTLHLVRTIHRPIGPPTVHEIVLDVNTGVRRSDPGSLPNNPDELLSVLTLNRPLDRFLDDYEDLIGLMEQGLV